MFHMHNLQLPQRLFYGELKVGKCPQHKPKKRFHDCLKENIKGLEMDVSNWEELSHDRVHWRKSIENGIKLFEAKHVRNEKLKCDLRKGSMHDLPPDCKSWEYNICHCVLNLKSGYVNHLNLLDSATT